MNMMTLNKMLVTSAIAASIITGCASTKHQAIPNQGIIDQSDLKAVDHVAWRPTIAIDSAKVINKLPPQGATSLVFVRKMDNDVHHTGANISINDRYQVSLHPNNYTQVNSCAGINNISVESTGLKTNDLLLNAKEFVLEADGIYFFYVDVDDQTSQTTIKQVDKQTAEKLLANKTYQSHQVTRVVPNCPAAKPEPVAPPPPPVLEKEVQIELEVLFDTDKAIIKPEFFHEVAEVADFMKLYSNTTAIIEGHTDSRASDSYNQKLSQRRADAVKQMLIDYYGISADRLDSIGYGESRPRATNDTKAGRQLNRRTIAVIHERVRLDQHGNQILD